MLQGIVSELMPFVRVASLLGDRREAGFLKFDVEFLDNQGRIGYVPAGQKKFLVDDLLAGLGFVVGL
jgi:hypothetical protein